MTLLVGAKGHFTRLKGSTHNNMANLTYHRHDLPDLSSQLNNNRIKFTSFRIGRIIANNLRFVNPHRRHRRIGQFSHAATHAMKLDR